LSGKTADVKLSQRVAAQIRDEIIAGQIPAGSALRLIPLAERLDVSTTPVREALAILERQGLLVSEMHRGFFVAVISAKEIAGIYDVHAHISELLAESATRRLTDEDIDELEHLDVRMRAATERGDAAEAGNCNHELHRRINLKAGLPLLVCFLSETTPFVARRQDPDIPGWAQQRMDGHHEILEALRRREARKAAELMGAHVRRAGAMASAFAESHGGPEVDGTAASTAKRSGRALIS
jgi:DNA-binding GntR family transcriptional regulator